MSIADKTKLDGIETAATADQTASEIKTLYEDSGNNNASYIKTQYESNSDTNAFTDAEKTKLSGITAGAGATTFVGLGDTPTNFTGAAGKTVKVNSSGNALEFVTVTTPTQDIVDDTTPQLGGNLDVQTREINTSTTNGNIKLNPNGTGVVEIKGAGGADGTLQLNCSANSHGVKIKSPPHSAAQSYTLTLPSNIVNGQFLKTDSNGNLSWAAAGSQTIAINTLSSSGGAGGGSCLLYTSPSPRD